MTLCSEHDNQNAESFHHPKSFIKYDHILRNSQFEITLLKKARRRHHTMKVTENFESVVSSS